MNVQERRGRERRKIELPVEITGIDGTATVLKAVTRNISSGGGVCFVLPDRLNPGSEVHYIVNLSPDSGEPVRIACSGRISRCVGLDSGRNEIALTMETYRFLHGAGSGSGGVAT